MDWKKMSLKIYKIKKTFWSLLGLCKSNSIFLLILYLIFTVIWYNVNTIKIYFYCNYSMNKYKNRYKEFDKDLQKDDD